MKIMVSIVSKDEAITAYKAGADFIDIKNPNEGSLGAQSPAVIKQIVEAIPKNNNIEISATVGDVPFLPCTVAQAAYAVASFGVDYVKIGFKGCETVEEVNKLATQILLAVNEFPKTKVIVGCYADYRECGTLSPFDILKGIKGTSVKGMLIDTLSKDGRNLFDFMSKNELNAIVDEVHEAGFMCALAGSIKLEHIDELKMLKANITGVRGAICDGSRMGNIVPEKIVKFIESTKLPV